MAFEIINSLTYLLLLSARPAVTFPAQELYRPSTNTKLYRLVTEAYKREQLAEGYYAALSLWELNPRPSDRKSNALPLRHCAIETLKTRS